MTLPEFNHLTLDERYLAIWDNGTYLTSRRSGDYLINLYWVDGFFTELWFAGSNYEVNKITSFKNSDGLEAYLPLIGIKNLLN